MYAYRNLIIYRSQPLSIVEEPEFRLQTKFSISFSRKKVRGVLLLLVELVEQKIVRRLKDTKCGIMYDGWTYNGVHHLVIITVYNRNINFLRMEND